MKYFQHKSRFAKKKSLLITKKKGSKPITKAHKCEKLNATHSKESPRSFQKGEKIFHPKAQLSE